MKRLACLSLLLLPLAGCAFLDDCAEFSQREWHKYTDEPTSSCDAGPPPVRSCDGQVIQVRAQTAEPPR
jgi:hypothetical protein